METREVDKRGDQKCHRNGKMEKLALDTKLSGRKPEESRAEN